MSSKFKSVFCKLLCLKYKPKIFCINWNKLPFKNLVYFWCPCIMISSSVFLWEICPCVDVCASLSVCALCAFLQLFLPFLCLFCLILVGFFLFYLILVFGFRCLFVIHFTLWGYRVCSVFTSTEGLGSIPSTHIWAYSHLQLYFQGICGPVPASSYVRQPHSIHTDVQAKNIHIKWKWIKSKKFSFHILVFFPILLLLGTTQVDNYCQFSFTYLFSSNVNPWIEKHFLHILCSLKIFLIYTHQTDTNLMTEFHRVVLWSA